MALAAGTIFECNASATASNVNGGGFNPLNANMLTDGAATVATGNSPVFTSASYSFVAGDVGHWVYIKSGTNWTPGWYSVASVSAGAATLVGNVGSAVQYSTFSNEPLPSTVAGCATTASPTGATWTMDYSQSTASRFTATDLTGTTTSCTSAANPFSAQMVGNIINLVSGTGVTAGRYEILSVSVVTATLDRSAGATYSVVTYNTGGALSLGAASDTTATGALPNSTTTGQSRIYFKSGSYTTGAALSVTAGVTANRSVAEGYNSIRGDRPSITSGNQPNINGVANTFTANNYTMFRNITYTSSNAAAITSTGTNNTFIDSKIIQSSTSNRFGINCGTVATFLGCEIISYHGPGIIQTGAGTLFLDGCYLHDSLYGINASSTTNLVVINSIFAGCSTACILDGAASVDFLFNNTFFGAGLKTNGSAISRNNNTISMFAYGNIFYGFTTAILQTTGASTASRTDYNTFFNNTNNVTSIANCPEGQNDVFLDPQFTDVTAISFSNATTSGTVLTSSGADFSSVTDGRDSLLLLSGTGVSGGIYNITSHTTTTLTLDLSPGTNATADKVGTITIGRNFGVGTNMKGRGFPGPFPSTSTISYLDIGAVQRQEAGGMLVHPGMSGGVRG